MPRLGTFGKVPQKPGSCFAWRGGDLSKERRRAVSLGEPLRASDAAFPTAKERIGLHRRASAILTTLRSAQAHKEGGGRSSQAAEHRAGLPSRPLGSGAPAEREQSEDTR
jgi:hypothetical protein